MLMMRRFKATRLAGLILLALSLVAGWQVTVIPSPPVYAEVGPHLVPGVSAVFLTLLALAYLLADRQGLSVDASDDPDERPHEGANKRLPSRRLCLCRDCKSLRFATHRSRPCHGGSFHDALLAAVCQGLGRAARPPGPWARRLSPYPAQPIDPPAIGLHRAGTRDKRWQVLML
ncbi:MAG: hypothetical protein EBU09_05325 [Betaproteobacteria bacterium]|nr:hypothetical protein [Betaproteobacteria bacterium]